MTHIEKGQTTFLCRSIMVENHWYKDILSIFIICFLVFQKLWASFFMRDIYWRMHFFRKLFMFLQFRYFMVYHLRAKNIFFQWLIYDNKLCQCACVCECACVWMSEFGDSIAKKKIKSELYFASSIIESFRHKLINLSRVEEPKIFSFESVLGYVY